MNSFVTISVLLLAIVLPAVWSTNVSHCKNSPGIFPQKVDIKGCTAEPCTVRRGDDVVMDVTFQSPGNLAHIAPKVIATVNGAKVNYPVGDDACPGMNPHCPLVKNQVASYRFKLPILKIYPKIALNIQFSLTDKDNKNQDVVCLSVNIKVVD